MSQTQQQAAQQILVTTQDASVEQGAAGSFLRLLSNNLGKEVMAEFVVGVEDIVRKSGTLLAVNTDYLVLGEAQTDVVCDLYSLRFITFFPPGAGPEPAAANTVAGTPSTASARTHAQAAFNYAKRKTRKLE